MVDWIHFTSEVLEKLHNKGYDYFVFENGEQLKEITPLRSEYIELGADYLCKIYPFKDHAQALLKASEKGENYIMQYDDPLIELAEGVQFLAVMVLDI